MVICGVGFERSVVTETDTFYYKVSVLSGPSDTTSNQNETN
jgi:hypothetical protein